jgi:mRNA interferase HigB
MITYIQMEVVMHIITQKRIWDAKKKHPTAAGSLDGWYRVIKNNKFKNFSELKLTFNSVDKVGSFYVFDVGGNKIRIIATIHFNSHKVYIRNVLTHKEYDKGKWK